MFATMRPYAPPPPPGAQPPPLWGREEHVRGLLGDGTADLRARREELPVRTFATAAAFRDYFEERYGPTIATYRGLAAQPERAAALDAELEAMAERFRRGPGTPLDLAWEYLLVTAQRAPAPA